VSTEARRMSVIVDSRGINAVAADLNKLDKIGDRVSSGLGKITSKLRDFGSWFMHHKLLITAAAAAIGAAVVLPYAKLETALVRTRIALGGTAEDMQLLEDLAIHLGQDTIYSATEAAEGMLQLAKAGYDVNAIVAATPGVLNAAIVEELDLATASEIVVSALAMFKLGADQATRAADVLAKGANIALTDMPGLAEGLKMVGYTASEMGYSLEEAVALMSMLSQFKIEGSMAGTALRSGAAAFSEFGLGQYTAVQKTILKTLGIGTDALTKKIASGELDLVRFLGRLSEAGAEIGHMNILFGQRAGQTMLAIAQGAATVFDEYVESLENAVGFTERAGGLLEDTVSGSMKRIKNSVLTMTNALMRTVAPDFIRFLDTKMKPFIDRITREWERGGDTWGEKMTSVFKNVLAPAMETGLEMLGQMIRDWTPELVGIMAEVVDAAVPAVLSGLAKGLWTVVKTAAEGWLFGLPKALAKGADQLIGPYVRLFPHGYDMSGGEGYDPGRTFRDAQPATNAWAEALVNRVNAGATSPYLPGLPEKPPVGPLRLPEENAPTVTEEPKLTFWGRLGALWTQGVDYIRRLLGVSEDTEENTSDLAGDTASEEDPLTSFLSQGLGALESTLLSAVTEPITSELEEWLEPMSSRLGTLTSNVLHKFDFLLVGVTSILDILVGLTGGEDYKEGRTAAQGQFAYAPAGAGGTSYNGGGVQIQNLNVQGYRDGETAGKAAASEIAKSEEISTRAMARGLRAGMTSREAQEY
jgi:TP901 family phage tail tape measure protein